MKTQILCKIKIMNIVVCLKQVPDTQDIKWTEKGTMIREGVESIINPFDEFALEYALKIKDKIPSAKITALSMGPMQAQNLLKVAIAKGADEAILACDKKFAGADTYATGKTISNAIRKVLPDFDIVICGQFAIDGDTAQTGPCIAQFLNISQVTYVKEILNYNDNTFTIKRELDNGIETVQVKSPVLICVLQSDFEPTRALINGVIKANKKEIELLRAMTK